MNGLAGQDGSHHYIQSDNNFDVSYTYLFVHYNQSDIDTSLLDAVVIRKRLLRVAEQLNKLNKCTYYAVLTKIYN